MTELQWSLNFELKLEAKRMTRWSSYTHNKKMGNEHETKKKRKTKIKKKRCHKRSQQQLYDLLRWQLMARKISEIKKSEIRNRNEGNKT